MSSLLKTVPAVLLALLGPALCAADEPAAEAAAPAASSAASPLAASAYLDASCVHQDANGAFVGGGPDRVFDARHDGCALQQAAVNAGILPVHGLGVFLNATVGDDARIISAYPHVLTDSRIDLTQAYLQYAFGRVTVLMGRFVTLAGAEVIAAPVDTNASRSMAFGFAVPFTHTGARASVTASDTLTLVLGVNRGWDDVSDTNRSRTLEAGATYAPTKTFSLAASTYLGRERVAGLTANGPEGQRSLLDVVATWSMNSRLTWVANLDVGRQEGVATAGGGPLTSTARWDAFDLYANVALAPQWRLSLRAELFNDHDGYRTGVVQRYRGLTATAAWLAGPHVELRGEVRRDGSDNQVFENATPGVAPSSAQTSVMVEGLLKY